MLEYWAATDAAFHSPSTVVTNLVIAMQAFVLAFRLLQRARTDVVRLWLLFFVFMALAALTGAVKHGEIVSRPAVWYLAVIASNTFTVMAAAFAELATVRTLIGRGRGRWLLECAILAQIVVVFLISVFRPDFLPAFLATVAGLTPVMFIEWRESRRGRTGASPIARGFGLTAIGGFAYAMRITLAPWVTYIDIAHLFTVASLALIYRGVLERASAELEPAEEPADSGDRGWSWLRA